MPEQRRQRLPDLPVEAGFPQFLYEDSVRVSQHIQPFARHLADYADGKTRARERMPPYRVFRKAELGAQGPNFVLEEESQRLS